MKSKNSPYVVSQMCKDYEKSPGQNNRLVFNCPIQRPEGQWSNIAQSLLIHTMLQDYLIPNVCIVQHGADDFEPMTVLDGKQRMTIIYNYINNGFKLNRNTPPVEIVVAETDENGELVKDERGLTKTHLETIEVKNKKFDKLPKEFQDKIKNFTLNVTMITEATKKELEEQMFRFNNGKSPTATHKAFMKGGIDVTDAIKTRILANNFFCDRFNMTTAQEKASEDMKCAFHILALLTDADFNKLTSGDLTKIAESMKNEWHEGTFSEMNIEYCNDLLESLNLWLPEETAFNEKDVLTTVHIPIMVMNVEKAKQMIDDEELTVEQYKAFLRYWTTTGIYKPEYKECSEGSPSDKRNIERRIAFMEEELCKFVNRENNNINNVEISENINENDDFIDEVDQRIDITKKEEFEGISDDSDNLLDNLNETSFEQERDVVEFSLDDCKNEDLNEFAQEFVSDEMAIASLMQSTTNPFNSFEVDYLYKMVEWFNSYGNKSMLSNCLKYKKMVTDCGISEDDVNLPLYIWGMKYIYDNNIQFEIDEVEWLKKLHKNGLLEISNDDNSSNSTIIQKQDKIIKNINKILQGGIENANIVW